MRNLTKTLKTSVLSTMMIAVIGVGALSGASSAFAADCLTNQSALPPISLSQDSMIPNAGFGYDKDAYDAALAKGNACPTTQQSQPVADFSNSTHRAHVQSN